MEAKLTFKYDRQGDILYISKTPPYPEQQSEELGDELSPGSTQKLGRLKISKYCSSQPTSCARFA
jgi:hypothetical protein